MNAEMINPFLKSVLEVLSTMAMIEATPGKPFLKKERLATGDVTGMIGLVGEKAKGSLAISFSENAIRHISTQMLGEEPAALDDGIADLVGEITNMVSGNAKRMLSEKGYKFEMAIPSTVIGREHQILHNTKGPVVVVPFEMDKGKFFIEVCFEDNALK